MLAFGSFYSIFSPLTDVFESVIKFFHNSGGIGWGLSIIFMTIAVRAVMLPLTFNSMKSMVRMQAHSPQLKAIQAKYKEDRVRQQQEMQKFYKENNLNPIGACLPTVLQLPVFIALYAMLRENLRNDICPGIQTAFQKSYAAKHNVSLHTASAQTTVCGAHGGSNFLFIHDLTAKATGVTLVVLMLLYVGSQLSSSLLMTATADKSQRQIMLVMPLIFVAFVFRFPSGLLVYWITTNLWTIAQQYVIRKRMGVTRAALESSGAIPEGSAALAKGGNRSDEGLITMLRRRMSEASDTGANGSAKASGRSSGAAATKPSSRAVGRPSANTNGSDGSAKSSSSRSRSSNGKASSKANGNGDGNGSGKANGNGNGAAAESGNGSSATPGARPPQSPRKRKKRSGRRR